MINRRNLMGAGLSLIAVRAAASGGAIEALAEGLIPDRAEDQSALFQKLVDAAAKQGKALYLGAGAYRIAGISLPVHTRLIGAPGQTLLQLAGDETLLSAQDADHIRLTGLQLRGNGGKNTQESTGLLDMLNCRDISIDDCGFSNSATQGIYMDRCSGRIQNCSFTGIYGAGVASQNGAGIWITNNSIEDCANLGVYIARDEVGFDGTIVTGNRISGIDWKEGGNGQNGNGVNAFRASNVVISNNLITDCAFSAVRLNTTHDCQITGNNCRNLAEVAIFSEFGFSGSVISDNIINGAAQGIAITNFDDNGRLAVCANNIVRNIWQESPTNPDTMPVGIGVEADTVVSGNLVENVPGFGIQIGWGPYLRDVAATGNIVRQCDIGVGISVVDGVGRSSISGNLVQADEHGLKYAGLEWDNIVQADLLSVQSEYPLIRFSGNH